MYFGNCPSLLTSSQYSIGFPSRFNTLRLLKISLSINSRHVILLFGIYMVNNFFSIFPKTKFVCMLPLQLRPWATLRNIEPNFSMCNPCGSFATVSSF